jgi:hypothetical protein
MFNKANKRLNNIKSYLINKNAKGFRKLKDNYHNESVAETVKKVFEKNKIIRYEDELIQHVDPIYQDPEAEGYFNIRAHFYAPRKHFMGNFYGTFWFNLIVILVMTAILYVALYYQALYKLLNLPQKVNLKKLIFRKK